MTAVVAYVDGASRGNPGDAAYGVRVCSREGDELAAFGDYLGTRTNNYAEYSGLLAALAWALDNEVSDLEVVSDSELMVKQMNGKYRVKSPKLKPLFDEARSRAGKLDSFRIRHVLRHENTDADRLANRAIDERAWFSE
jgi:probable phosphoglycerate mutase